MVKETETINADQSRPVASTRAKFIRLVGLLAVLFGPLVQAVHFGSRLVDWLPVWSWYADPGYQYLLNGAVIVNGGVPGHTDHPGTSTQSVIGLIEQLTFWISGSSDSIFVDLVEDPEKYAQVVSWVFLTLYIAALIFLGVRMRRAFGTPVAVLSQLMLLWAITLLGSGVFKLVPETLVLLAFIVLVSLLIPNLKDPRNTTHLWIAITVGVVSAVGVTSKVIFIPAILLPIILLPWRKLLIALAAFFVATLVIMIPTFSRIDRMWSWYSGVLLGSGRHGGEVEQSTVDNLLSASEGITGLVRWWTLSFLLLLSLSIILYAVPKVRMQIGIRILSEVALVATSAGVIAMGYKQSETRDFLLLGVTTAILAGVLLWLYRMVLPVRLGLVVTGLALIASAYLAAHGLVGSTYFYPLITERSMERVASGEKLNELATRGILAQSYDSWTLPGSLSFAEDWTNDEFSQAIADRYPDTYEYSIWDQRIYSWNAGTGRQALSCSEIVGLAQAQDVFIVVPGLGTLAIDQDLQRITSPDGTIVVTQQEPIGPNFVFEVVDMECAASLGSEAPS